MYNSLILHQAKQDIREAAIWYNAKQKGLGKRFVREVREKVLFIQKNPKACNVKYDNVRTAVLNIFPYMIHYVVDDKNKTVIISAVLHTSRNPEIWERRSKGQE